MLDLVGIISLTLKGIINYYTRKLILVRVQFIQAMVMPIKGPVAQHTKPFSPLGRYTIKPGNVHTIVRTFFNYFFLFVKKCCMASNKSQLSFLSTSDKY